MEGKDAESPRQTEASTEEQSSKAEDVALAEDIGSTQAATGNSTTFSAEETHECSAGSKITTQECTSDSMAMDSDLALPSSDSNQPETVEQDLTRESGKLSDDGAEAKDKEALVVVDSGCPITAGPSESPSTSVSFTTGVVISSGESSPVSSQGQDSGVSPDEAMQESVEQQQQSPQAYNNNIPGPTEAEKCFTVDKTLPQGEKDSSNAKGGVQTPEEHREESRLVSPSGHHSPEGSGGLSETQVTVSDLDSPTTPASLQGVATAVAEASGATAAAGGVDNKDEAATASGGTVSSSSPKADAESVYYIKWIMFDGCSVPIVTQNENGPCPLLALVNVLLLKGKVKLAPMLEMITSEQLMTYLGECILENTPKDLPETTQANYEQNMQDAMGVMHKLQTGLDVNVRFTGVREFEYTPELIVFDLLGISLFHGWLVDPQDTLTVQAVNQCSYNQLVEKIILLKTSDKEESVTQALTAEQFLERSASQLTYHGLAELSTMVKENELCVFFRNNHFNTLYRHKSELFLLVTDQGFLTENQVVWETLSNVEGDCHFTDATFRTYTKPTPSTEPILPDPNVAVGSPEQIDHDYQVALFLQEEASASAVNWPAGYPQDQAPSVQADHDLAMRLQEEENRREALQAQHAAGPAQPPGHQYPHQQQWARPPHQQQQQQGAEAGGNRRRGAGDRRERDDKNCTIL